MDSRVNDFVKYGQVFLGRNVFVGIHCAIGCPKEESIKQHINSELPLEDIVSPVQISDNCIVGNHVCILEGVRISSSTLVEDHVRIGYDCEIGKNVRIMYGSYICDRVTIGRDARIAGFICDGAQIGDRSTIMGDLIHEYSRPHLGWWEVDEPPPVIESDVVVGFRATIIGGIHIASFVYVASCATVTKSVPSGHIVKGINEQIPLRDWNGEKLGDLIAYWDRQHQLKHGTALV